MRRQIFSTGSACVKKNKMANICHGLQIFFFFSSPQVTYPYRIYWCKKNGWKISHLGTFKRLQIQALMGGVKYGVIIRKDPGFPSIYYWGICCVWSMEYNNPGRALDFPLCVLFLEGPCTPRQRVPWLNSRARATGWICIRAGWIHLL